MFLQYDRSDVGDLYRLLRCHRGFGLKLLRSAAWVAGLELHKLVDVSAKSKCTVLESPCVLCKGNGRFPRAAADRRVCVHRSSSESAEEHDGVPAVLLSHGAHVLHPLHVHGEVTQKHKSVIYAVLT